MDVNSGLNTEFDEAWYLAAYPDVKAAVEAGAMESGAEHYQHHGRAEGRLPNPHASEPPLTEAQRQQRVSEVWSAAEQSTGWYWMAHHMVQQRLNRLASGDPARDAYGRLADVLRERGVRLPIPRAVSLGCGFGGLERDLAARGMITEIDAYDIAPGAIAAARRLAEAAGLPGLRYHVADLETAALPHGSVDVVFAHQSVHHVERLDELFTAVRHMLRPGGIFHLHEFVGPIRFQWTDAQISLVNRFLEQLPPRLRALPNGEPRPPQGRATVAAMIAADPSEAIRSSEILPVLRRHFEILEIRELGGALLHLGLGDIAQNFDPDFAEDRAILEAFFAAEDAAMQSGEIGSDFVVVTALAKPAPDDFDEMFYLATYPDIAQAVADGLMPSGHEHYIKHGRAEGRLGKPAVAEAIPADFDEAWYLKEYPDIAAAVQKGQLASGYQHWRETGRAEGRLPPPGYEETDVFEADWYGSVYHAARDDVAAGRATDFHDHFQRIGRFRGYLPNRFAPRPDAPAAFRSRFGGFWLDQGNAADLIEGKRETGRLSEAQAGLLHAWLQQGYVILRQAVAPEVIDRAVDVVRRAYAGEMPGLKFECLALGGFHPSPWGEAVRTTPAKALDLHWLSEEIRDVVLAPALREFMELVFERRALATQSLTFLRGSAQGYHQDTLYVPYTLPTQFVASWVALEDVQPGGGELTYFPGSQQLPDMLFAGKYKTLWDAQRMLRRNSIREEMADYSARLEAASLNAGLKPERFMARKGDVLFWHADLAHGGLPISNAATRMSVVTHYCPKELAPLTFERGSTAWRSYQDKAWYATGYYARH